MAKVEHYHTEFEAERFYHVYNRTIDKGRLFTNAGNYVFFLKKYDEYLSPFVDTYSYCLLGNHFHLLINILPETQIRTNFEKMYPASQHKYADKSVHLIVSHQFQKFFQSYAMAYNKQQDRIGTLFQKPFKRALVDNDTYFTNLVYYIHANPQKHGIIADFRDYEWSSYQRILIEKPSKLRKIDVLNWFGGREGYLTFHGQDDDNLPSDLNLDE